MKFLPERVYNQMARRGLRTKRALWREAQKLNPHLQEPTVWHAISGERDVEVDTAAAIAQALGCSMDFLYGLSDQIREGEPMQVESELTALVQRLNGLTPDQRRRLADIMSQLLDLTREVDGTYNVRTRMPGEIATTLNGALYAVSNPDADVDTLAAMFDKMPAESVRRIQRVIDDWSAAQDLEESTGDCELAPAKPPRLFPDE